MRVLVTGVNGQLGHDVVKELEKRGHSAVPTDIADMDITDKIAVMNFVKRSRVDAVVHCAAWTAVDNAEEVANRDKVFKINGEGTRNIAEACKTFDCKMVYISTDYVFGGDGCEPWKPDCKSFAPLNVYGASKLDGEKAVEELLKKYFIVRIAWVFGLNGNNFVKTMLKLSSTHESLRVVKDQIGTPTYTLDLARLLVDMLETDKYGYYHATNEGGYISWADFAKKIFEYSGAKTNVVPVTTVEYGISKAKRPFNSRLDKSKLLENGFKPLPEWTDALSRYLKEIEKNVAD